MWDLPPVILKPAGDYLTLLAEARELYTAGHFYSRVAMCGIVAERLAKDVLRAALLIQRSGTPMAPSETAFAQLERVDASAIFRFLKEADLLSMAAARLPTISASFGTSTRTLAARSLGRTPSRPSSSFTFSWRVPFQFSRTSRSKMGALRPRPRDRGAKIRGPRLAGRPA